jgi:hypothetical protein
LKTRYAISVGAVLGSVLVGCVLVTGSTDGYTTSTAPPSYACVTPQQCTGAYIPDGGEAGPNDPTTVCCLTLDTAESIAGTSCLPRCLVPALQICVRDSDCASGSCFSHTCPDPQGGKSITLSTCDRIAACPGSDAGAFAVPDASTDSAGDASADAPAEATVTDAAPDVVDAGRD